MGLKDVINNVKNIFRKEKEKEKGNAEPNIIKRRRKRIV